METSNACFLAFDTSCYTTSIALVSQGKVVYDNRIMLEVPKGNRGMRQSEAVFHHVKNMKQLFLDYSQHHEFHVKAVSYSEKPCPKEGSYMPVFCVGESMAISSAAALHVPVYPMTHQHGHIYGAFFDNALEDGTYCAFHVSGGTLEVLRVVVKGSIKSIETIGGTLDITCGQLIDRVGVAAGLKFPSGREMEQHYRPDAKRLSVNVKGLSANLSGAETQAMRLLNDGCDVADVCSGVIDCASTTLVKLTRNAIKEHGFKKFVFTGGVICNRIIREDLLKTCDELDAKCIIAQKEYCSDNACGLALGAEILFNKGETC